MIITFLLGVLGGVLGAALLQYCYGTQITDMARTNKVKALETQLREKKP